MSGFYVHIPFCVKKCAYCDFVSYPETEHKEAYLSALQKEITLTAQREPWREPVSTIFIGGGTPSLLTQEEIATLLCCIREHYPVTPDAEITMECNPGTAVRDQLKGYFEAGVNRLSIGLQSADDRLLRCIGRIHDKQAFSDTYEAAVAAGFRNINVDCMHGLPGQSQEDYLATLAYVTSLEKVTHISSYSLILEEGTPLYRMVKNGSVQLPDEDAVADMQDAGLRYLWEQGFFRYEVSNFARPGHECAHNLNYWANGAYAGVGCAAHSARRFDGKWTRYYNVSSLEDYLKCLEQGLLPREGMEEIPMREEMFECLMLGLRTRQGVNCMDFQARFGHTIWEVYGNGLTRLEAEGLLSVNGGSIALTDRGLDIENEILLPFMDD